MEYLAYRGVFADIPFDEIRVAFRHYYPRMTRAQEEMRCLGGDFGAEGAAEADQEVSLAPRSFGYVALLVALGSFGPLTMSIYTPVMPSVGASLGAGAGQRQAHAHHLHAGLRRRPALLRAAQRPLRPPAGAAGRADLLHRRDLRLFLRAVDRRADRPAHPAGAGRGLRLGDRPRDDARCLHLPGDAAGHELDLARPEHRAVAGADARRLSRRMGELARDLLVRRRLRHAPARDHAVRPRGDQQVPQRAPRISAACCAARARCCATASSSATC